MNVRKRSLSIFLISALFVSCADVLKSPVFPTPDNPVYGTISLNLIDEIDVDAQAPGMARTVMPAVTFAKYEYFFKKDGTGPELDLSPDNDGSFTLELGDYTVTVKAYGGGPDNYTLVAEGESDSFTINSGVNEPVTVPLAVVTTGQGTFDYTITWSGTGAVDISITLQKWSDKSDVPLPAGNSQTIELETGFYLITSVVSQKGYSGGFSEIVHIYPGLTTTYVKDFEDIHVAFPPTLAIDAWAAGNVTTPDGEEWYRFVATSVNHYIHVEFGTLSNLYVQLYKTDGTTEGGQTNLFGSNRYTPRTGLTVGDVYYIRVWPYSGYVGTYRVGVTTSTTPPTAITLPTTGVIELTFDTWENGNLPSASDVQWYKFTATADTQFIHVQRSGTMMASAQLYNAGGATVGAQAVFWSEVRNASLTLTAGNVYYIKVSPYSGYVGEYQIAFNESFIPPGTAVSELAANTWADGNLAVNGEQWFRFTSTADTWFTYFQRGTLTAANVQLYDSDGATVGDRLTLGSSFASRPVTENQVYYIRVWPASGSGTYRIGFNGSFMPIGGITELTVDTWAAGSIAVNDEQWFWFTATAETQYIHFEYGTLYSLNIQLYDSNVATTGGQTYFTSSDDTTSRTLTIGDMYYIRVWPYSSSGSGAYRIVFSESFIPPGVAVTELSMNRWTNDSFITSNAHWFRFTATENTHYIYCNWGTLTSLAVYVYGSAGETVRDRVGLSSYNTTTGAITLSAGQVYYVKITGSSGTYQIGVTDLFSAPTVAALPDDAIPLTLNVWENGFFASYASAQWFKFTATLNGSQYIYFERGGATDVNVQLYDSTGSVVGGQTNLYSSSFYTTRSVTTGQEYYIRVTPYSSTSPVGAYRMAIAESNTAPTMAALPTENITQLIFNTWEDGVIAGGAAQWYKFTATASPQYFHFFPGTINSVSMYVYDASGALVGSATSLSGSTSRTVTVDQEYYVRITGGNGTYNIAFNASSTPPPIPMPPAITLTANVWEDGVLSAGDDGQWFKFTATAATHYIHFEAGTLSTIYVQLYDGVTGESIQGQTYFNFSSPSTSRTGLAVGGEYYIRVTPSGSNRGTYRIAFNGSTSPPITLPTVNITTLTVDVWEPGTMTSGGEQWFKFTATADPQYIQFDSGFVNALGNVYVVLFDSTGTAIDSGVSLTNDAPSVTRTVNINSEYYIKVTGNNGLYRIKFSGSFKPPDAVVTPLVFDTWATGSLASADDEQWFSFTATVTSQRIHFQSQPGGVTSVYIQLYAGDGNIIGGQSSMLNGSSVARTVNAGQEYYIRVKYSGSTGAYKIAFNDETPPPGTLILSFNTWESGLVGGSNAQWFKFTATVTGSQFLHFAPGTVVSGTNSLSYAGLQVRLYSGSDATAVNTTGGYAYSTLTSGTSYDSWNVTEGQVYWIRVVSNVSEITDFSFTFRLGFNTSFVPPP